MSSSVQGEVVEANRKLNQNRTRKQEVVSGQAEFDEASKTKNTTPQCSMIRCESASSLGRATLAHFQWELAITFTQPRASSGHQARSGSRGRHRSRTFKYQHVFSVHCCLARGVCFCFRREEIKVEQQLVSRSIGLRVCFLYSPIFTFLVLHQKQF